MSTLDTTTEAHANTRAASAEDLPDYAPIPLAAFGPALNEQGYDVTTLPGVGDYIAPRRAIIAPPAVQERLRCPRETLTPSVSDGKRVRLPMRWAAYWSSEMVLRNPPLPGCGAAVRKQLSAGCPPSTSGFQTPLKTVKSSR